MQVTEGNVEDRDILVVSYLGGWRLRRDGWQSRQYRCQADAIKIAFEMARGIKNGRVLLQEDDVTFSELRWRESNLPRAS